MLKVLSIVGPTAVGKTNFALLVAQHALQLSKVTGVDIISADSRQVYQGLEIISGADIPEGFEKKYIFEWSDLNTYFEKEKIRLFGIGLLQPSEDWSVSQFQTYAQRVIELSQSQHRLVILVGGTGLYQQHLFTTDPQLHIPPNTDVRQRADIMSLAELQAWLQEIQPQRFENMNQSDRQNPRRLIRAIEIGLVPVKNDRDVSAALTSNLDTLTIGLTDSIDSINERIGIRVTERLAAGAANEVEKLVDRYPNQKLPLYSATGVKVLIALASGQISESECIELWTRQERQYAKRQLTWWKKQTNVEWINIAESNWQSRALDQIESWWEA